MTPLNVKQGNQPLEAKKERVTIVTSGADRFALQFFFFFFPKVRSSARSGVSLCSRDIQGRIIERRGSARLVTAKVQFFSLSDPMCLKVKSRRWQKLISAR